MIQAGPVFFPRRYCGPGTSPREGVGCSSFMYNGPELDTVRNELGRGDAWGKIFFNPLGRSLAEYVWQGTHPPEHICNSLLLDATAIQNIAASYGLAPRVYALFLVKNAQKGTTHPAQLCQYIAQPPDNEAVKMATFAALAELGEELGYSAFRDLRGSNCRGRQWLDFQGWRFTNTYQVRLALRVQELGRFQGPPGSYQSVPELVLGGRRDTAQRIRQLALDQVNFSGQSVLDLGCHVGGFCRYALECGARRVVGIDKPKPVRAAAELSAYLGSYNIDYVALDLREATLSDIVAQTGMGQFDIVLFLAMRLHVGYPDWLPTVCRRLLVYETHPHPSPASLDRARAELGDGFDEVRYIGKSGDQYPRAVLWAVKNSGGVS